MDYDIARSVMTLVLLLVFIVVHLLHFTTQRIDPAGWRGRMDAAGDRDRRPGFLLVRRDHPIKSILRAG